MRCIPFLNRLRGGASRLPLLLSAMALLTAAPPGRAQPAARRTPQQAAPPRRYINTLKEGLEVLNWNPARRGPLLALAAEQVGLWMPEREPGDWYAPYLPPTPVPDPPAGGFNPQVLGEYFGRKLVKVGSVSILAPTEMVVLKTDLPDPDPYASMPRNTRLTLLQASLSEAQWRQIASQQGLGLDNLDPEQQKLFLSILPDPLRVVRFKPYESGGHQLVYPDLPPGADPGQQRDPRITFSEQQRRSVRIRLNRKVQMMIPAAGNPSYYGAGVYDSPKTDEFLQLAHAEDIQRGDQFGVRVREKVPSRMKKSQLDFAAPQLDPVVGLKGAKTVADLIKRIQDATRLEIYADPRIGKLAVHGLGLEGTARAGDLLKALCLAVTGTMRQVGPAFVLTDDIVGLGTRVAHIAAWYHGGEARRQELIHKAQEKIQAKQPVSLIQFAPDDPLNPGKELMERVEASWKNLQGRYIGERVRLTELPEALRLQAQEAIQNHQNSEEGTKRPILTDRVNISLQIGATLMVPGVGDIRGNDLTFDSLQAMLPPPTEFTEPDGKKLSREPAILPALKQGVVLYVAPTDKTQAELAAEVARKRGFTQLWIQMPPTLEKGKETLEAAIAAGKRAGLSVYAVVSALQVPAENEGGLSAERDINVMGETASAMAKRIKQYPERWPGQRVGMNQESDWLIPDSPTALALVRRRIVSVARIPGLKGIVLRDLAAPGYTSPKFSSVETGSDFGYTLDRRLALLRKAGYDPIDLGGNTWVGTSIELPFLGGEETRYIEGADGVHRADPTFVTPTMVWNQLRFDAQRPFLTELHRALRRELPQDMPLLAREIQGFYSTWFGSWDKAERVPLQAVTQMDYSFDPEGNSTAPRKRDIDYAREFSETVYGVQIFTPADLSGEIIRYIGLEVGSRSYFAMRINQSLENDKKNRNNWDGIVFDFSLLPVERVSDVILGGIAPPTGQSVPQPGQ